MSFRSLCRHHPTENVRDRRRPFAAVLAPLTPSAPCVLHRSDEDAPRRRLPPQPGCWRRSAPLLHERLCTVGRPSPCGRDGGPADRDTTWTSPFELKLSHEIGWQEPCPAHQGQRPCAFARSKTS